MYAPSSIWFRSEFTANEHALAQEVMESQTSVSRYGCLWSVVALMAFTCAKVAAKAALVLLPGVLLAIVWHDFLGRRFWRARRGSKFLIWLRRFHRRDLGRFPFGTLLQSACLKQATPITIQDSTYRTSMSSLVARGGISLMAVGFVGLVAALLGVLAVGAICIGVGSMIGLPDYVSGLLLLPAAFLIGPFVFYRTILRAGYRRLRAATGRRVVAGLVQRAKEGRLSWALQVLKCGDDFWQDVVLEGLRSADAVVIDVTDIGPSVRWELSQVSKLVPPERIVLCCACQHGRTLPEEAELMRELMLIFGADALERCRRITYDLPAEHNLVAGHLVGWLRRHPVIAGLLFSQDYIALQRAVTLALDGRRPELGYIYGEH